MEIIIKLEKIKDTIALLPTTDDKYLMTLLKSLSGNRFRCRGDVSDEDLGHSVERSSTMSQSIDTRQ